MKSKDQTLLEEAYSKVNENLISSELRDLLTRYEELKYELADKEITREKWTKLSLQLLDQIVGCLYSDDLEDQTIRSANA